jgi:hypothetical protein
MNELVWSNGGLNSEGENQQVLIKNVYQCHFVHHKSCMTNWCLKQPLQGQAGE